MKSFFKKLAFVMAMAMVVSLAAPAAAQAATPLYLAYQNETDEIKVHKMTALNETVDFCFKGALPGWRDLERGWDSSDKTVATVDNNGLVTAVGYGTTTITFELAGYETAKAVVIVEEPVAVDTFEVVQKTEAKFDIEFAGETKYTADDVTLYIVYPNAANPEKPIKIKWPVKSASKKDNTISVEPFVAFNDGDTYMIQVGDLEPVVKETVIGEITDVEITPDKYEVYANDEDNDGNEVKFTVKLLSNGVDLTNYYIDAVDDIEYVITATDDAKENIDSDTDKDYVFHLEFWEEGIPAAVQATVTYKVGGVKKEVKSNSVGVASIKQPAWALVGVADWALVEEGWNIKDGEIEDAKKKVDWTKKSIPADATEEKDYVIVLKLIDSREKTYVTHKGCTEDGANIYINGNDAISEADYELNFYSADTDSMLVDVDGAIAVYKECEAVFYVGLENTEDGSEKYIWADTIEVTEGSKLDEIYVKDHKSSITVVTQTLAGPGAIETVEMVAEDQYNNAWADVAYTVDTNEDKADDAVSPEGKNIKVDGSKLADVAKTSVTVTVKGKDANTGIEKTTTFTVVIVNPRIDEDKESANYGKIILDNVTKTRYKTYDKITLNTANKDMNAKDSTDGDMFAEITLDKTSAGAVVGKYTGITVITNKDQIKTITNEGLQYVVVRDPSGNVVEDVTWSGDKLTVQLAEADATTKKMSYAATGKYTVEVVTIRYNQKNGNQNNYVVDGSFEVSNTTPDVDFLEKAKNEFTGNAPTSEDDLATLKAIVLETLKFDRGGEWKDVTADMITAVDAVVLSDYVIIKSVSFNVPIDGKTVTKDAAKFPFYTDTVYGINVSVKKAAPAQQ